MYYSQIRVDPTNENIVYTGGINVMKSTEGGKNFRDLQNNGIAHTDNHALCIDPKNPQRVLIGNDGGLNLTYDGGESWEFINTMAVGLFYAVAADMRKPYYVCGGLQDNGSWCGPSQTRSGGGGLVFGGGGGGGGIVNDDWYRIGGGDGFYAQIDPTDYNTIYTESQDGNISRVDLKTGRRVAITPRGTGGARGGPPPSEATLETPTTAPPGAGGPQRSNVIPPPPPSERYRFYWNTPMVLSPHNPRTVYVGGNRLFTSMNRGDTWTASADLTRNIDRNKLAIMGVPGTQPMISKNDGAGSYSHIVTIAESPWQPGVIWIGTNDGYVQVSRDGGATWTNVSSQIPGMVEHSHVSRVEPSHFDAGTCYVTMDNHRLDDLKPYVFVTHDFGASWQTISNNLPVGNVNVIREDPKNKNLLYLGTEFAFFVSLDGGKEWKKFMTGLPTVRIDDILVHPRDNDLIVGTHGRSIYIMDDITPLQQLSEKVMAEEAHLFEARPGVQWNSDITLSRFTGGGKNFRGENPQPGTAISYYFKAEVAGEVKLTISDITGKVIRNLPVSKEVGLHRAQWNMSGDPPPPPAGQPGQAGGGGRQGGGGGAQGQPGGGGGGRQGLGGGGGQPVEPGTYLIKLTVDGKEYTTKVVVEADPGKDQ
jgi:photosystem II stability/assembly factor-like uncharacterized protein